MKPPKNSEAKKQAARALDVEISFLEGVLRRDPNYVEALQILGDLYTRRGRAKDGLRVDLKLSRLRPADPLVFYNLACSQSLAGQLDAALESLRKALALGYNDWKFLSEDPDLENLRRDPRFARWIQQHKK